jgi:hypothetical protein
MLSYSYSNITAGIPGPSRAKNAQFPAGNHPATGTSTASVACPLDEKSIKISGKKIRPHWGRIWGDFPTIHYEFSLGLGPISSRQQSLGSGL